eukprot:TRINITY_DN11940_c0_g1_i1.p1 TRINITY_DN11940_c0_g1~~TRINITY_DN11940_c0_g1_i1.p1  ORF type:complete len:257 (+),score=52.83 TRINITY_DN11940_c0_g1_i1:54-824(+)
MEEERRNNDEGQGRGDGFWGVNYDGALKTEPITATQQRVVTRTYLITAAMAVVMTLGFYMTHTFPVITNTAFEAQGSLLMMLGIAAVSFFSMVANLTEAQRIPINLLLAFFMGMSGAVHAMLYGITFGMAGTALGIASGVFLLLSFFAHTRQSRFMIYGSFMFSLSLFSLLFLFVNPFGIGFDTYLFLTLLLNSAYVIFDTQIMLRRIENGDHQASRHAMFLFMDLFRIALRIMILLRGRQEGGESSSKRKSRPSR